MNIAVLFYDYQRVFKFLDTILIVFKHYRPGDIREQLMSRLRYIGNTFEVESLPQKEVDTDVQGKVEELLFPIKTSKD